MMKLLLILFNLPLPVLLLGMAGFFILFLVMIILVVCIPSAGERFVRFLALLEGPELRKKPGSRKLEKYGTVFRERRCDVL